MLPFPFRANLKIVNARNCEFLRLQEVKSSRLVFIYKTLNCIICKLNIKTESLKNLAYIGKFIKRYITKESPLDIYLLYFEYFILFTTIINV